MFSSNYIPYRPSDVGQLYQARTDEFIEVGKQSNFSPASDDKIKTLLLLIDMQIDFIHTDGSLCVPGAIADTRRLIEFIYVKTDQITRINATFDSHVPTMIFFPSWWINPNTQKAPPPFTTITSQDIISKVWTPIFDPGWSYFYVQELEKQNKNLIIWPYHTLQGTAGHLLSPALSEAIAYHSSARKTNPVYIQKGTTPQTENYGIFTPEVEYQTTPRISKTSISLLNDIFSFDRIVVAGQASSHCVLETLKQAATLFPPQIFSRITLLTDCTSPVQHPDIDFEKITTIELEKLQALGLKQNRSLILSL
jgi:nicotinamidase-related amidase